MDTSDKQPSIDPLRRVYVPIEKHMLDGDWRFRTSDKQQYTRSGTTGEIRRTDPKPLSKKEKRRAQR